MFEALTVGKVFYFFLSEIFWCYIGAIAGVAGPMIGCYIIGPAYRRFMRLPQKGGMQDPGQAWGFVAIMTMMAGAAGSGIAATCCVIFGLETSSKIRLMTGLNSIYAAGLSLLAASSYI